jgi:hypothetical protein
MLLPEHRDYLLSRSYTEAMVGSEEITSLPPGNHTLEGVEVSTSHPVIAWICRSPSRAVAGVQTRRIDQHEYRWYQAPRAQHLPILYGAEADHNLLYDRGRMVIAEGIFDRAALKRCLPEHAVYGRLSKGISKHLIHFVLRYAEVLWLAFDQDTAGISATETTAKRLEKKLELLQLKLPYKDPSAMIENLGEKRAREIVIRQVRALEPEV